MSTNRKGNIFGSMHRERNTSQSKIEVKQAMEKEWWCSNGNTVIFIRITSDKNIAMQVLQTTIAIKMVNLLRSMLQLRIAVTTTWDSHWQEGKMSQEKGEDLIVESPLHDEQVIDPILLMDIVTKKSVVVSMEICEKNPINTIIDGGLGVNWLPEDTWKHFDKTTIWPPTF